MLGYVFNIHDINVSLYKSYDILIIKAREVLRNSLNLIITLPVDGNEGAPCLDLGMEENEGAEEWVGESSGFVSQSAEK